eukprot:TRINITY_DN4309_c0_g2_i1.p1 TRINITY_DN4309_c0_g2~~TRINITY_DN4309_c0_g2_i1.p1  ORF type:complete len:576 (+),score=102.16 TRINITY_DN4309_c0_g2_i1:49-1776(+)
MSDDDDDYYCSGPDEEEIEYDDTSDVGASDLITETSLLQLEVQYLRMKGFRAGHLVSELYGVTTMVGFSVNDVCDEMQMRAAGLHKDLFVVIALTFPSSPPQYLAKCPGPGKVTVRQSSDTCLENKQTLTDAVEFGLWWTLEQRLTEHLQQHWDQLKQNCLDEMTRMQERDSEAPWSQVMNVLNLANETGVQVDLRLATLLVKRSAGRFDTIQECLFDEERMDKLRKQAATEFMYMDEPDWPKFSLLLHVIKFLKQRIARCTEKCIVCDKPHPLKLLKPVACDSPLCNYQMANLGLGVNLENEILRNPTVVDFLISTTFAAAAANNKYTRFPFEDGAEEVHAALKLCPRVDDMSKIIEKGESLKDFVEQKHKSLYKIIRWIIASNTSHISPIAKEHRIKDMPEHQFILASSTPAAEARFQELKEKNGGTFYAFHGSALNSWHSILRGGLKQLDHRTAYGPGIYMATNATTSLGYMTTAAGFPNSKLGAQLRIMALCEVIAEGSSTQCGGRVHRPKCECNKQSPHIRVESEECVVTRVLFLFTDSCCTYNVDAKNIKLATIDRSGRSRSEAANILA